MKTTRQDGDSHYTGLPLDDEYCTKTLYIYPTQEMQDGFQSDDPIRFAMMTAAIFLFTSLVFIAYDLIVARRQRIVMNRALASGAIVNSLFPKAVRQQMYEENVRQQEQQAAVSKFRSEPADVPQVKANAQLYEETTIFFADLAGFTKWSSQRTPLEVFDLLETLYASFDKVAAKRKVFKVSGYETWRCFRGVVTAS